MPDTKRTLSPPIRESGYARQLIEMFRVYAQVDGARLIHVAKTVLAVVIATGVSMRVELAAPRTAMVTVVILMMHQHSGMVLARGFYRGVGMLVGNLAAIVLIAAFPQERVLFLTALVLWIGCCTWGAAYFRNYQSYGFVLAGYATCIAALPSIDRPYDIIANVVTGLSEVSIGILSAGLVSALVLPLHVRAMLMKAGQDHCADMLQFVRAALTGTLAPDEQQRRYLRIVAARAQLENLRSAAVFEDHDLRVRNDVMAHMAGQILDANARVHTLHRYLVRLAHGSNEAAARLVRAHCADAVQSLPDGAPAQPFDLASAERIATELDRAIARLPADAALAATLTEASALRDARTGIALLRQALVSLHAYLADFIAIRLPADDLAAAPPARPPKLGTTANRMVAAAAGCRAVVAIGAVSLFWIASGWTAASGAVISATIASALYSIMPAPAAATRQVALGCAVAWLASLFFNFSLLPSLDGFASLAAALALFIMVGAYLNSFPGTAAFGLGFSIYFCFLGNITNPGVYAPEATLDAGFAAVLGIAAASLAYSVVAPYGGEWSTRLYLRQLRRLVAVDACYGELDGLIARFDAGVRDFVLQIAARPASGRLGQRELLTWTFASMEIGRSIVEMRTATASASPSDAWRARERALCDAVSRLFVHADIDSVQTAEQAAADALALLDTASTGAPDVLLQLRHVVHFIHVSLQYNLVSLPLESDAPHATPA
ncbi:FUSC family protein [Burkholderia sp. PU8-34]